MSSWRRRPASSAFFYVSISPAATRLRASPFLLLVQKKGTKEKDTLRPRPRYARLPSFLENIGGHQLADLLRCRVAPASKSGSNRGCPCFRYFLRDSAVSKGMLRALVARLYWNSVLFCLSVFFIPSGEAEHRSGRRISPQGGGTDAATSQSVQGCTVWRARLARDAQGLGLATKFVAKRTSRSGEFLWVLSCRYKKVPRRAGARARFHI